MLSDYISIKPFSILLIIHNTIVLINMSLGYLTRRLGRRLVLPVATR